VEAQDTVSFVLFISVFIPEDRDRCVGGLLAHSRTVPCRNRFCLKGGTRSGTSRVLFSHKEEENYVVDRKMDGTGGHRVIKIRQTPKDKRHIFSHTQNLDLWNREEKRGAWKRKGKVWSEYCTSSKHTRCVREMA
jgi:hypothetical protein